MTVTMPEVTACSVDGCGYNHDEACSAYAITVGGIATGSGCATFIPLSAKGGLDKYVAKVGACTRADCSHNDHLECAATGVRIGSGAGGHEANCLTFAAR